MSARKLGISGLLVIGLAGCQGWAGGYSPQSITRVPPIGTGTYQLPGSYYGTAAAPNQTTMNSMGTGLTAMSDPASMGLPATTVTATPAAGPVMPAQYTAPVSDPYNAAPVMPAAVAPTNLQWQ